MGALGFTSNIQSPNADCVNQPIWWQMVVIGLFTQLWSGMVSLIITTALEKILQREKMHSLLHGALLVLMFMVSLVCLLVAFVFAANSSADTALRISSSILMLIVGKHAAVPLFRCTRFQQFVKSGVAELKERIQQEGDASLDAGGATRAAEDESLRAVGMQKKQQKKEDGEGKQKDRDEEPTEKRSDTDGEVLTFMRLQEKYKQVYQPEEIAAWWEDGCVLLELAPIQEEHAASSIQDAVKEHQKEKKKNKKQEDGEKLGEKKEAEKATGEGDAAEQEHAASAIQDAFNQQHQQKEKKKKKKQEDGEKTGKKKKETEKATGEGDAA